MMERKMKDQVKSKNIFKIVLLLILVLTCALLLPACKLSSKTAEVSLGTWWWSKNLDVDEYLDFAKQNNVTEIYYCDYSLNDNVANFVEKVCQSGIKVYMLAGEKEWLEDRTGLDNLIEKYINFQNNHQYKFSGIHLDIEPHQFSDFQQNRTTYLYKLVDLIKTNKTLYSQIKFDYDIPFWLDDEIEYNNVVKETYKHILDFADRTFIMSYRDTYQKMINVSIDEIDYARQNNKVLFLCAETYSEEGDSVSFYEEGKNYMQSELETLRAQLPETFGIAIHNIKTWKSLID